MKIRIIQEQWFWRWVFKVFKRSRKPTAEKSSLENARFLSFRTFFVGKYGIQSNFTRVFDFPPSDLMRPLYCRSADARMRMQNALLLCKPIVNLKQWEWGIPTDGSWILSKINFRAGLYLREGEHRFFFSSKSAYWSRAELQPILDHSAYGFGNARVIPWWSLFYMRRRALGRDWRWTEHKDLYLTPS